MSFIKFENVCFSYENTDEKVIDNASFEIAEGECVCLVGSNGAGKSTILQLLVGLLQASKGEIKVDNVTICKKNIAEVREILGFVFQDFDAQLFMPNIYQDIAFGPTNFGYNDVGQRVEKIAEALGIKDILYKPAFKLSGGEKKLASLACVLAVNPKGILLDEPTTALDPRNRKCLINIIKNLNKTKLITTHDLDMAMEIGDRVIVLNKGKIVADGKPYDILLNEELMLKNGLELPLGRYDV